MALTRINNQALTNVTSAGLPSGSIINIYEADNASDVSVTDSTTKDVITLNVTPTTTNSKFYILFSGHCRLGGGNMTRKMGGLKIQKVISGTTTTIANTTDSVETMHLSQANNHAEVDSQLTMHVIDAPNTTSQVTYKVVMKGHDTLTGQFYVFRKTFGTRLVVMEIAG